MVAFLMFSAYLGGRHTETTKIDIIFDFAISFERHESSSTYFQQNPYKDNYDIIKGEVFSSPFQLLLGLVAIFFRRSTIPAFSESFLKIWVPSKFRKAAA